MASETRGVLYIASREPYLGEAAESARSVREHNPDLPITLYAPADVDTDTMAAFDAVHLLENPSHDFADSNLTPERIPYDRTLFLDSDTYVCGSLEPVFDLLDDHDLAATQDPTRTGSVDHGHDHDVPECFPQYNTGVLALRDCDRVHDLLEQWCRLYHDLEGVHHGLNQPSFRVALYDSDVKLATLPPEWNFRIGNVANSVLYACGEVQILHGRSMHWGLAEAAARVNATDERRVVVAKPYPELITDSERTAGEETQYLADRAHWAYQKRGAVSMVLTVGSMVRDKLVKA